jgi:hypothetical protein
MLEEFGKLLSKVNAIKHTCGSETAQVKISSGNELK